jgi:hypothetical protein
MDDKCMKKSNENTLKQMRNFVCTYMFQKLNVFFFYHLSYKPMQYKKSNFKIKPRIPFYTINTDNITTAHYPKSIDYSLKLNCTSYD